MSSFHSLSEVNAARVRAFARAKGLRAKTDQIDAAVLREFGELLRPEALEAPSPARRRLAALVQRREQLVNLLSMEEQRLTQIRDKAVQKLGVVLVRQLRQQIAQIEKMIKAQIGLGISREYAVKTGSASKGCWQLSEVKWVMITLPNRTFEKLSLVIPWD